MYCTSLESVKLPSTLRDIGFRAFQGCESLRKVILHEKIRKIEEDAFRRCGSLDVFKFPNLSYRLDSIIQAVYLIEFNNKVDETCSVV